MNPNEQLSSEEAHYPRPALASELADALLGRTAFSSDGDGMFIAGERRTGKSKFLQYDLKPELARRGLIVIYVDLMSDPQQGSLEVLHQALREAVQEHLGALSKTVKAVGLDKISVPGFMTIDLKAIGKTEGLSIFQVLSTIQKASGKPIGLIVDEAQHVLTSEAGEGAMWALKSARDQMKTRDGANLRLVMSGSHADKLSLLVNSPKAPFWGSQVRQLPNLGDDFAAAAASKIRRLRPELATVRDSAVVQAFAHVGRRPPLFNEAVSMALKNATDTEQFERELSARALRQTELDRTRFTDAYLALNASERVVLWRLLEKGAAYRPFDAAALAFYNSQLSDATLSSGQVQTVLDSLRNNSEQLVWKSQRGQYSVYDQGLIAWYAHLVAAQAWPPMEPA